MNSSMLRSVIMKKSPNVAVWYDYFAKETRKKLGKDKVETLLRQYKDDFVVATREDEMWGVVERHATGGVGFLASEKVLDSWDSLTHFLDHVVPATIARGIRLRKNSRESLKKRDDRYVIGHWWSLYYETLNYLRGVENAFCDIMLEQDKVIRLFEGLEQYFFSMVDQFVATWQVDGIWFGDDYGMQDRMMISPELFRDLFKPFLSRFAKKVKSHGLDLFMHTCGDITPIIPDLIEAGVDVLHPIQPGTMDAQQVVKDFGDQLTFFVGADIQHVLIEGSPEDIRSHVKELSDIFSPSGGFLLSCANTIMPETPEENIKALFEAFYERSTY